MIDYKQYENYDKIFNVIYKSQNVEITQDTTPTLIQPIYIVHVADRKAIYTNIVEAFAFALDVCNRC